MNNHFKVIIAGGRDFNQYDVVKPFCDKIFESIVNPFIISGGAKGVDALGKRYAIERGFPYKIFPADWNKYKLAAGPIRNREMAKEADCLIAFWDGKSKGTKDMITVAKSKGIVVHIKMI